VTSDQSKRLKIGARVCFGGDQAGTVTATHARYLTIKWADGHQSFTGHDDMKPFLEVLFRLEPFNQPICGKVGHSRVHFRKRECFSEDFPMTPKTIATLLILSAFATAGANSASAQGGGFHGRGFHGRGVGGYGFVGGYGYGDDNGYGDWYGISPDHDECPLFRRRVRTRDGWRVRMVPIC
jgi:hypothetical protein